MLHFHLHFLNTSWGYSPSSIVEDQQYVLVKQRFHRHFDIMYSNNVICWLKVLSALCNCDKVFALCNPANHFHSFK